MRAAATSREGAITGVRLDPVVLATVALSVLVGVGLGTGAGRGFGLIELAITFVPFTLLFPVGAHIWAVGALTAVVLSRVLVEVGAPGLVNHLHFGMALMAVARGIVSQHPWTPLARRLAGGLVGVLVFAYISAFANDGDLLTPGLTWLLFVEPFMIVFGLVRDPPSPTARRRIGHLLVGLLALQLPFAIWKFRQWGFSDAVRGTFLDQGAGAHVMGAMALVCATGAVLTGHVRSRGGKLALIGLALLLNVLADAKQSIGMFVIAVSAIGVINSPRHWPRYALGLAAAVGFVFLAARYHEPLRLFTKWSLMERGLSHKVSVVPLVASHFDSPTDWLLGAGPGKTVSRVALMGLAGYRSEGTSGMPFDLSPSELTHIVWYENELGELSGAGGSSAWSLFSSWVGIWGDLGVLGVLLYLVLGFVIWRASLKLDAKASNAVRLTIAFTASLGFVFSYLEEPGLMLVAAGWIGLACSQPQRAGGREARQDAGAAGP